jgi:hypothetical protein
MMLRYQYLPKNLVSELAVLANRADVFGAICDACALGIIHGKRVERKKRKHR